MSSIRDGDAHLHYSDNSHRWLPPYELGRMTQAAWQAAVNAHVDEHRSRPDPPRRGSGLQDPRGSTPFGQAVREHRQARQRTGAEAAQRARRETRDQPNSRP